MNAWMIMDVNIQEIYANLLDNPIESLSFKDGSKSVERSFVEENVFREALL